MLITDLLASGKASKTLQTLWSSLSDNISQSDFLNSGEADSSLQKFLRRASVGVNVVTHDGLFHADETLACTLLSMLAKLHVERTRNTQAIENADVVLDVGSCYDPNDLRFDHHQFKETERQQHPEGFRPDGGVPYSSCGLIWKHFGEDIARLLDCPEDLVPQFVAEIDTTIIQGIDATDCGYFKALPATDFSKVNLIDLSAMIKMTNADDIYSDMQDERFERNICYFADWFRSVFTSIINRLKLKAEVNEMMDQQQGDLLVMPKAYPWEQVYWERGDRSYKLVVFNSKPGQWMIRSTAVSAQELKKSAYPLPNDWRGLKDRERKLGPCDLVFTHATGFLAGVYADSQEEAVEAAKAWLELL
jgi:uncharacterized UPF0160 family protein